MKLLILLGLLVSFDVMGFGNIDFGGFGTIKTVKKVSNMPDWVKDVKSGGGLVVNTGSGRTLFRDISHGSTDVCEKSKRVNKNNLKDMYPFVKYIPTIKVVHVYYNKSENWCATTISVSTRVLSKLDSLSLKIITENLLK